MNRSRVWLAFMSTLVMSIGSMTHAESSGDQAGKEGKESMKTAKVLVAYYSWSGNTREVAKQIQKATGGDLFEIQPVDPYPSDYQAVVDQAKKEIKAGYKPVLKTTVKDIGKYDIVFVGSPNWWSTIAPPVSAFLASADLSGKTVVPFITHGGGGMANCAADIKRLCPKSNVLTGLAISGSSAKSSQDEVSTWIAEILKNYH